MEPPVSIKAETLLNSRNFLPVEGVQLAALDKIDDFVGNLTEGSCHEYKGKVEKKITRRNSILNKNNLKYLVLLTNNNSSTNTMHSS